MRGMIGIIRVISKGLYGIEFSQKFNGGHTLEIEYKKHCNMGFGRFTVNTNEFQYENELLPPCCNTICIKQNCNKCTNKVILL